MLLDEEEFGALRATAQRHGMTVSEWVRQLIRDGAQRDDAGDPARKLEVIRWASGFSFPTADVDEMLGEIEQGYKTADLA